MQCEVDVRCDVQRVEAAVLNATGLRYMQVLVESLARVLDVPYAFIAERSPADRQLARTIALADRGGPVAPLSFLLTGTPCEEVSRNGAFSIATAVWRGYPGDGSLEAMGAEAYAGTLVAAREGWKCGWLSVMDTRPRQDIARIAAVLAAMRRRTGLELSWMRLRRDEMAARDRLAAVHSEFMPASD